MVGRAIFVLKIGTLLLDISNKKKHCVRQRSPRPERFRVPRRSSKHKEAAEILFNPIGAMGLLSILKKVRDSTDVYV